MQQTMGRTGAGRSFAAAAAKLALTQSEITRRRQALLLDHARVARELTSCQNPRFKPQLNAELEYLEKQLASLGPAA